MRKRIRLAVTAVTLTILGGFFAGLVVLQGGPGAPVPKGTVEVYGLKIRKKIASLDPPKKEEEAPSPEFDNFGINSEAVVVAVQLLVTFKDRVIVDLDEKAARLTVLADDKGTNLIKTKPGKEPRVTDWLLLDGWTGFFLYDNGLKLSEDGRSTLTLVSAQLPAAGATKLVLKGQLGFEIGKKTRTAEWTRPTEPSKKQGEYKIGPFSLTATKDSCETGSNKRNMVKQIAFFDSKGQEIKTESNSRGWFPGHYTRGYPLNPDYAKVRVEYFSETETVIVPLDLEISMGL